MPEPLNVRYKDELQEKRDSSPFALLAAFPKVIARRSVSDSRRKTDLVRVERGALVQDNGNPLANRKAPLSSGFGMRKHPLLGGWRPHHGIDLAAPIGSPVHATADGVVSASGRRGGYGLAITLEHEGSETRYAHLSRVMVKSGQRVKRGEVIGLVGSSGLSTGPHLHYETWVNGRPVNPLPRMRGK